MNSKKHKKHGIDNPHDKLCFSALRNLNIARDALRSILPKELLEQIDLNRLKLYNTKLITPQMKELQADIFYEAPFKETNALILIHFEQLTNAFRTIPLKVWQYIFLELMAYSENHPNQPLPVPFPVIVYTGERQFTYSTDLFDLFGDNKERVKSLFYDGVKLIDVCRMPDEDIRKNRLFGLCEYAFKYKSTKNFIEFVETLIPWLSEVEDEIGPDYAKILIQYVIDAFPNGDVQLFIKQVKTHLSKTSGGKAMTIAEQLLAEGKRQGMTIAEQLKQEGIRQGIKIAKKQWKQESIEQEIKIAKEHWKQEGIKQGMKIAKQWKQEAIKQGEHKSQKNIARQLLMLGVDIAIIAKSTGLGISEIQALSSL